MIETQVINYVLDSHDTSFILLNNINSDFFPLCKKQWLYIEEHVKNYGNVPDKESFLTKFPDFDLFEVTETPNYLLNELVKNYQATYLADTFNEIRKNITVKNDIDRAMEIYRKSQDILARSTALSSTSLIDSVKDRYTQYLDRSTNFNKYYVRTGLPELDAVIGGWDRNDELATLVARPNVGKSYVMLLFALAAAMQGLTVGIYSGEMSVDKVGYRLDTLIQHLSNGALTHGNIKIQDGYKTYAETLKGRIKGDIKVITPQSIGGPAGVSALRAFIEKDNLDILFIDQHSLLEDDRKAKNPVEKASNISRDLKNLQVMKKLPIIAVSQQNREKNEDGVGTENVAQSDRISQDSTILLFLERDKKDKTLLTITLVKSRDSEVGKKLTYKVDFNLGTFQYIPSEEDAEQNSSYEHRYDEGAIQANEFTSPDPENDGFDIFQ